MVRRAKTAYDSTSDEVSGMRTRTGLWRAVTRLAKTSGGQGLLSPIRILVVDDFEPWRSFVCLVLGRRAGFQVVGQASCGEEAIRQVEALQPNLIVLDISMPDLDGIEAARRIRVVAPQCLIVMLTLQNSSELAREALKAGAHGFVLKIDAERDLVLAIEAVLNGEQFVSGGLQD